VKISTLDTLHYLEECHGFHADDCPRSHRDVGDALELVLAAYTPLSAEVKHHVRWALRYGRPLGLVLLRRRFAAETAGFLAACREVGVDLPEVPAEVPPGAARAVLGGL
jgi:hypothetical protein